MRGSSELSRKIRKIHYFVRERKCALGIRLHIWKAPTHKTINPFERRDLELRMLLKVFPSLQRTAQETFPLRFSCPSSHKPLQLWSEQPGCTPSWQQILAVPFAGCWFCSMKDAILRSAGGLLQVSENWEGQQRATGLDSCKEALGGPYMVLWRWSLGCSGDPGMLEKPGS